MTLQESVSEAIARRRKRELEPKNEAREMDAHGGVLAQVPARELSVEQEAAIVTDAFDEAWKENKLWLRHVLSDAVAFAQTHAPRDSDTIEMALRPETWLSTDDAAAALSSNFAQTWQSLKNRGWQATLVTEGEQTGKTLYAFDGKQVC